MLVTELFVKAGMIMATTVHNILVVGLGESEDGRKDLKRIHLLLIVFFSTLNLLSLSHVWKGHPGIYTYPYTCISEHFPEFSN